MRAVPQDDCPRWCWPPPQGRKEPPQVSVPAGPDRRSPRRGSDNAQREFGWRARRPPLAEWSGGCRGPDSEARPVPAAATQCSGRAYALCLDRSVGVPLPWPAEARAERSRVAVELRREDLALSDAARCQRPRPGAPATAAPRRAELPAEPEDRHSREPAAWRSLASRSLVESGARRARVRPEPAGRLAPYASRNSVAWLDGRDRWALAAGRDSDECDRSCMKGAINSPATTIAPAHERSTSLIPTL